MRIIRRFSAWPMMSRCATMLAILALALVAPRLPADVPTGAHAYCARSTGNTYYILLDNVDANRDGRIDKMFDSWSPVSRVHGTTHLTPPVYTSRPSATVVVRMTSAWVGVCNRVSSIIDTTVETRSDGTGWYKLTAFRNSNGTRGPVVYQMSSFAQLFLHDLVAQ